MSSPDPYVSFLEERGLTVDHQIILPLSVSGTNVTATAALLAAQVLSLDLAAEVQSKACVDPRGLRRRELNCLLSLSFKLWRTAN